jgi:hypothetical protein
MNLRRPLNNETVRIHSEYVVLERV